MEVVREARTRARQAFHAGPDPYAELDVGMATRLGGALWLVGVMYALLVLPFAPPESGTRGWAGVAAVLGLAAVVGVWMLRRDQPLPPDSLFAIVIGGVVLATVFRWFTGPSSPFGQLLFLACLYSAAIHPARRTLFVLGLATAASISPVLWEGLASDFVARTLGQLAFTWSLGLIILLWTTRMRGLRAEIRVAREQAERLARVDPLTGLGNKRALDESLAAVVAQCRRDGKPFSVLISDLDAFKPVNDAHGHHAGDEMLRAVARALTTAVRLPDPCFRFGGDEFVALLPGAALHEAREIAMRVSSTVALSCRTPDGRAQRISVGVSELAGHETGEDALARADAELYAVKAQRKARARAS